MTEDEKENEDTKSRASGCFSILLGMALGFSIVYNTGKYSVLRGTHNIYEPIPGISAYEDSLVYSIGDSLLGARKARYDALRQDYYCTFDKQHELCRLWPMKGYYRANFDKSPVAPKYAKQIGVENLVQYDRYLDRYERDSLRPAYKSAYNNKVVPMIRNNMRSK